MSTPDLPAELVGAVPFSDAEVDEALLVAQGIADDEGADVDTVLASDDAADPFRRWRPRTLDDAEWTARKFSAVEHRADEIDQQEKVWIDRVRLWAADERRRIAGARWFFRDRLEQFALDVRAADAARKTVNLPSVTVSTRSSAAKVVVVDEDAVLAWASGLSGDERAAVVKTVETVKMTGLREAVEIVEMVEEDSPTTYRLVVYPPTGEVVAGVEIDPGGVTATVKVEL